MQKLLLDSQASQHFTFRDLIQCSETATRLSISNQPKQDDTWQSLAALAMNLLDPIVDRFGPISLTYGFCSPELAQKINKNANPHIAPHLDQHSSHELRNSHELNNQDNLICTRLGAAVDFSVDSMPEQMHEVALWIVENLTFDRMYYYGNTRPLHISYGPQMNQFVQLMKTNAISGRRTPDKRASDIVAIKLLTLLDY